MKYYFICSLLIHATLASAQVVNSFDPISDSTVIADPVMTETADASKNTFRKHDLLIYPTRTSAIVNVIITTETKTNYTGEFYDTEGNLLRKVTLDALHNEINLKDLENGTYLFRVLSSGKQATETQIVVDKSFEPLFQ